MALAERIQGVPFRGALAGQTRAIRMEKTGPAGLSRVDWRSAMRGLFGERAFPPFRDDSQLTKRGAADFLAWHEVDEKRDSQVLVEFSQTATQAMLNENAGLPFLYLATELSISWAHRWEIIWTEIYSVAWAEVGPEGIGRETKWKRWSEGGETHRFKHHFTVPNEALVDPDYGRDTVAHGLEAVIQTALFTIMTETAYQIAMRPMYQEYQARVRAGTTAQYNFADYYERQNKFFLQAAIDINSASAMVTKHMHGDAGASTPKNLILYPDGCELYLSQIPRELRAFPSKMTDETEEAYILGQATKRLQIETSTIMPGVGGESTAIAKIPTFKRTRDEPEHQAIQPLRRRNTQAYAYQFPAVMPPESPDDALSYNHFVLPVHRLEMDKPGRFDKVHLDMGIIKSTAALFFLVIPVLLPPPCPLHVCVSVSPPLG
jgi:hypothetical protein